MIITEDLEDTPEDATLNRGRVVWLLDPLVGELEHRAQCLRVPLESLVRTILESHVAAARETVTALPGAPEAKSARLTLTVERAPDASARPRRFVIGRAGDAELKVEHPTISRHHALLHRRDDAWHLADLGSKNGVTKDGRAVEETRLEHGDQLWLGRVLVTIAVV